MEKQPNNPPAPEQPAGDASDPWDILQEAQDGSRQDKWTDDETWDVLQEAQDGARASVGKEAEERWQAFFEAQNEPFNTEAVETAEAADAEAPDAAEAEDADAESEDDFIPEEGPLIAVNLDRTHDMERTARQLAERRVNEELSKRGFFKKLIYSREYHRQKVYEEIMADMQGKNLGEESNLSDADYNIYDQASRERFKQAAIHQGVDAYEGLVHKEAGESYVENEEATAEAKRIIEEFVDGNLTEEEFNDEMSSVRRILNGEDPDSKGRNFVMDDYLRIAKTVQFRIQQGEDIERVMEGFKVIDADVRSGVRSEVQKTATDKIIDKLQDWKLKVPGLRAVPDVAIAGAAAVAIGVAQAGSKTLASALTLGIGGVVLSGAYAAMKEGNHLSADRAQRQAELAMGIAVGDTKYDRKLNETAYRMWPATELAARIKEAKDSDDLFAIVQQAENIIDRTDSGKDHICYSAPDQIEAERLALDLAIAEAKANFSDEQREKYAETEVLSYEQATIQLEANENKHDQAYRKLRRRRMAMRGAATATISAATMIGVQEVVAAFSPDIYGIPDEVFHLQNNADAKTTLMAKALGFQPRQIIPTADLESTSEGLTQQAAAEQPVAANSHQPVLSEQPTEVEVSDYAAENGIKVSRDWAANGTTQPDGTELQVYYTEGKEGLVTGFNGNATTWAHGEVNPVSEIANDNVKLLVTLQQGQDPIVIDGNILPNGQIEFIPEPGSIGDLAFESGFQGAYAEVAVMGDVVNGTQNVITLATLTGPGMDGTVSIMQPTVSGLDNIIPFPAGAVSAATAAAANTAATTAATEAVSTAATVATTGATIITPPAFAAAATAGMTPRANLTYVESTSEPESPEEESTPEVTDTTTESGATYDSAEVANILDGTGVSTENLRSADPAIRNAEYSKIEALENGTAAKANALNFLTENGLFDEYTEWLEGYNRANQAAA